MVFCSARLGFLKQFIHAVTSQLKLLQDINHHQTESLPCPRLVRARCSEPLTHAHSSDLPTASEAGHTSAPAQRGGHQAYCFCSYRPLSLPPLLPPYLVPHSPMAASSWACSEGGFPGQAQAPRWCKDRGILLHIHSAVLGFLRETEPMGWREGRRREGRRGRVGDGGRGGEKLGRLKNLHLSLLMGTVGMAEPDMSGVQLGLSLKD